MDAKLEHYKIDNWSLHLDCLLPYLYIVNMNYTYEVMQEWNKISDIKTLIIVFAG